MFHNTLTKWLNYSRGCCCWIMLIKCQKCGYVVLTELVILLSRHSATKGIIIAMICTFFDAFNVPVFWPILVMYFIMLFCITMKRQIKVSKKKTTYIDLHMHCIHRQCSCTGATPVWQTQSEKLYLTTCLILSAKFWLLGKNIWANLTNTWR